MKRLPALGATLALALACTDVAPPDRPAPYQFAIDCSVTNRCDPAAGNLQLIFHWPRHTLPVRIWVERSLRNDVITAVRLWMDAGIYGEFTAGLVRDSNFADIIVTQGPPVASVRTGSGSPLDCRGTTSIAIGIDTAIVLPFRTVLRPRAGSETDDVDRCLRVVAAHELGHTLGLFEDSDDPNDVMFSEPTATALTMRDRATFGALYHGDATVRIPAGR